MQTSKSQGFCFNNTSILIGSSLLLLIGSIADLLGRVDRKSCFPFGGISVGYLSYLIFRENVDKKSKRRLEILGVDEMTSVTPLNRFEESKPSQKVEKKIAPAASISQSFPNTLAHVAALEELKEAMIQFDGCSLKKTAMNLVFSDGNPEAEVMIIGEAPGADEDRQGKPFVGQSGQLLRRIFGCIGLTLDHLYITNVLPYRPPGNRQPTPIEISMFHPFLEKHIELINPKCLILVGGTATKALLDAKEGITQLRGRWFDLPLASGATIKTMVTYHPAYLLRSPLRKREVWKDMLALKGFLRG
jgi:uracil-DNA glycosylase family 4